MKKATLILAVITLSIIMFSCGSNSNNDSKTVTIKDSESGAKITANVNQKKLPSDFPSDFYLLKGDIEQISTIKLGDKQKVTIYMHIKSTPKEVRDEILKNMEAKGWETKMNVASQQYFTKGEKILRVGIVNEDNETGINYMATY